MVTFDRGFSISPKRIFEGFLRARAVNGGFRRARGDVLQTSARHPRSADEPRDVFTRGHSRELRPRLSPAVRRVALAAERATIDAADNNGRSVAVMRPFPPPRWAVGAGCAGAEAARRVRSQSLP
jgi:hypothetical protein